MFLLIFIGVGLYFGFTTGDWFGMWCIGGAFAVAIAWGILGGKRWVPKHVYLWVKNYVMGFGMTVGLVITFFVHYG